MGTKTALVPTPRVPSADGKQGREKPDRSPIAHMGWTQALLATGAAGSYSNIFSNHLLHPSMTGLNP